MKIWPIVAVVGGLGGIGAVLFFMTRKTTAMPMGPDPNDCKPYDTAPSTEELKNMGFTVVGMHRGVRIFQDNSDKSYNYSVKGAPSRSGFLKISQAVADMNGYCNSAIAGPAPLKMYAPGPFTGGRSITGV